MAVLGYAVLGHTVLGQPDVATGWGQTGIVTLAEVKSHLNIAATVTGTTTSCRSCSTTCSASWRPRRAALAVRDIVQAGEACTSDGAQRGAVPVLDVRPHVTMQVLGLVVDGSPVDVVDRRLDGPGLSWCRTSQGRRPRTRTGAPVATYRAGYASTLPWLRLATKRLVEHLWQRTQQAPHPALSQVGGGYDEAAPSTASYLLPYAVMSLIERHRALV